jgi:hypothetical protein
MGPSVVPTTIPLRMPMVASPSPTFDEIFDAVVLEDRGQAGQSAVPAVERHLEQRTRLAVDSEYGFEQEPDEEPADRELAH